MRPRSRGTHHFQTQLTSDVLRLEVEIVNDLHVIRHKPDRRHHDFFHARTCQRPEVIANVRSKPWLRRRTTATLINELPVVEIQLARNQTSGLSELHRVVAICCHRLRNAVRSKNEMCMADL